MSETDGSNRILGVNDLRGSVYVNGLPSDLYGKGLVLGFADAGGLSIPGIDASELGSLAVNAMGNGDSEITCISREFLHPSSRYLQHATDAGTWGDWETHDWDHSGFARLHEEQEFTEPQIFGKAVVETAIDMGAGTKIDVRLGGVFRKTVTAPVAFSVAGADDFEMDHAGVISFALQLTDGGLEEVTWWDGVLWPGGNTPSLTPAGVDLLGFLSMDSGLTWLGVVLGQNYK